MGYDEVMEQLEPGAFPGVPIWLKCPVCPLAIPYPVATYCINIAQARREAGIGTQPIPKPEAENSKDIAERLRSLLGKDFEGLLE